MKDTTNDQDTSPGMSAMIPDQAKELIEGAVTWVRNNPTQAAVLSAIGGLALGLTGVGRLYRGVNALRSIPMVSEFVLGALARGLLSNQSDSSDSIH